MLDQIRGLRNMINDLKLRMLGITSTDILGIRLNIWGNSISPQMRYILINGYEESDAILAEKHLNSNDRVIECGSSIGFMSLYCKKTIGIQEYMMIEANPCCIDLAKKNYQLNELPIGHYRNNAITPSNGIVSFNISNNFWSSSLINRTETKTTIEVEGVSLPEVLKTTPFTPNVLIMDIEGGEISIPLDHFCHFEKLIIELHPGIVGKAAVEEFVSRLIECGYYQHDNSGATYVFIQDPSKNCKWPMHADSHC